MSVFLILSNDVFVQTLRKIKRRVFGTDKKWPSTLNCRLVVYGMIGSVQINFMVGVVAFLQQFLGRAIDTI